MQNVQITGGGSILKMPPPRLGTFSAGGFSSVTGFIKKPSLPGGI
jgi:hypothetical protein